MMHGNTKLKVVWVLQAEEEVVDVGCRTEIWRKKTVLRAKILQTFFSHIRTVHLDIIKVLFIHQLMH